MVFIRVPAGSDLARPGIEDEPPVDPETVVTTHTYSEPSDGVSEPVNAAIDRWVQT
jgi:hypothetical protein